MNEFDASLNELESQAAALESEAPNIEGAENEGVNHDLAAYGMARMICEVLARGASMRWACLSYDDNVKHQGAEVLKPIVLKYDLQSEFMSKYAEEFAAGAFFAGVIFTSYQKVQADKVAKEKAAAEKESAVAE